MALNFIITVDTEADNQWQQDAPLTVANLKFVPRFQALCEEFGFIPTYLLTYEAAADKEFAAWLKGKVQGGKANFGAHLHPWSNPPFKDEAEKQTKSFPCDLAPEELRVKLIALTELIEQAVGARPRAFRAGRWGISSSVIKILKELGYEVDSSITPFLDWTQLIKKASPAMNFTAIKTTEPYDWHGLVEVPMTIVPVPRWGLAFGLLGNKLFYKKAWGRIFKGVEVKDLIQAFKAAERLGWSNFQFMTHSSELMSGGSIYNKTEAELEDFYAKLKSFFTFLTEQKVRPRALSASGRRE